MDQTSLLPCSQTQCNSVFRFLVVLLLSLCPSLRVMEERRRVLSSYSTQANVHLGEVTH
ncbi:hypothetical protein ES332_D02G111000v1 [Gossypium tomentosum]|uniref:Uncharacterized protein n=1 Tax=Gossypium tomentosum TaxID=34277 RepID=A0A5D2LVQ1_GOSTO|nr:hypothetical protein ES332_D02G111000v1 [Gossypium tomentosum]